MNRPASRAGAAGEPPGPPPEGAVGPPPGRFAGRRGVLALTACAAVLYLGSVTHRWWPTPDSALYLGLARSLAAGEGYRFNGAACTTVTPGLPLILAGLVRWLGPGFWAPNLLIALCGLAAVVMIYLVLSRLDRPAIGLWVAAATALSYAFYFNSHRILTDIPFTALFWAAVYSAVRCAQGGTAWIVPAALLAGAGVFVRAPGVLVIVPAAAGLALDRSAGRASGRLRRRLLAGAALLLAPLLVAGVFFLLARAAERQTPLYAELLLRWLRIGAGQRLRELGVGLTKLPAALAEMFLSQRGVVFNQAGLAALLLALVGVGRLWRRGSRLVPAVVVLYPIVLIVFASSWAVRVRYLLPAQAMFVYAAMEGLCVCLRAVRRRRPAPVGRHALPVAVKVFAIGMIACNAPRLLRNAVYYSYHSHTPRYYSVIRHGRYAEVLALAEVIRRDCPPEGRVGVMVGEVPVFHFLSGRLMVALPEAKLWRAQITRRSLPPRRRPRHADAIAEAVAADEDLRFVVLEVAGAQRRFLNRLAARVRAMPDLEVAYRGKRYVAYRRVGRAPG